MTETTLSRDDAQQLTDRIKVAVEGTWQLIREAYTSRAWSALGYDSWDEYCSAEFGGSRLRLPREERQEVVASLRESGLSTRAIASATGLNQSTISRDLSTDAKASVEEPSHITGVNGKSYTPTRPSPKPMAARPRPEPEPGLWYGGPEDADDGPAEPLTFPGAHANAAAPHAEADARRDAELDAQLDNTAARFRATFTSAMARSDDVWQYDIGRIAEVYGSPTDRRAVLGWVAEMRAWCDRVTEALDKTITLRSVGGDR